MARPRKKPANHLAPPDVLLGIAERKERKLSKQERVSVMTARRMEGHVETERQFAEIFSVHQWVKELVLAEVGHG